MVTAIHWSLIVANLYWASFTVSLRLQTDQDEVRRFEQVSLSTCKKYDWWRKNEVLEGGKSNRTIIFRYPGRVHGGLGDTLAGLISAAAAALISQRSLRFHVPAGFKAAFMPANGMPWKNVSMNSDDHPTIRCPASNCSEIIQNRNDDTLVFESNRAFVCQWRQMACDNAMPGLSGAFQRLGFFANQSDLFEAAGCLARAAIVPNHRVWDLVHPILKVRSNQPLICTHIRTHCADHWNCRGPIEATHSTPKNLTDCAEYIRAERFNKRGVLYAESDSWVMRDNMKAGLPNWLQLTNLDNSTYCHTDENLSERCWIPSVASFLILATCDAVVVQSRDDGNVTIPPSGFSRFAALYGLRGNAVWLSLPYKGASDHCGRIDDMGSVTQGSWRCTTPGPERVPTC